MYERLENGVMVISCTACSAVCLVASDDAKLGNPDDPENQPSAIAGRVYIRVRSGQIDSRFRRDVDGGPGEVALPGGRIISVREYPFFCDNCYEDGGSKLDATWQRVALKPCSTCAQVTRGYEGDETHCAECVGKRRRLRGRSGTPA